jgi:hypothetical protein
MNECEEGKKKSSLIHAVHIIDEWRRRKIAKIDEEK